MSKKLTRHAILGGIRHSQTEHTVPNRIQNAVLLMMKNELVPVMGSLKMAPSQRLSRDICQRIYSPSVKVQNALSTPAAVNTVARCGLHYFSTNAQMQGVRPVV